ncbi:MAG: hypothetical protein N4A46_13615 [Schleiferiaceae bacterium]|nr:hypothetical protein [Schleiferiaceae bacterium]
MVDSRMLFFLILLLSSFIAKGQKDSLQKRKCFFFDIQIFYPFNTAKGDLEEYINEKVVTSLGLGFKFDYEFESQHSIGINLSLFQLADKFILSSDGFTARNSLIEIISVSPTYGLASRNRKDKINIGPTINFHSNGPYQVENNLLYGVTFLYNRLLFRYRNDMDNIKIAGINFFVSAVLMENQWSNFNNSQSGNLKLNTSYLGIGLSASI